ncbi:MAG: response regulator [Alphaproteobacteria bacterium]|uniref:Response regulator n=1 Tax=Candidatus Nitrobium versatile TaxID=2884831 RepID=A0A953LXV1_9BACT|nr:response regulator [Candidatus Nitrobium versatile]
MADDRNKVLFVDDEENVLRSLRRMFVDEDIEILTAVSGREGLALLKENEVAVIVSDQRMPEMSGFEFLEKSMRIAPDAVRIVLTGYADVSAAISAINKGGVYRYLTKPWNDNEFVITILNSIERYSLVKENKRLTALTRQQNEELKQWSAKLEKYVQKQALDLKKQNAELKELNECLKGNLRDFISAFANLIELRDKSVSSHSGNVAVLSAEMARRRGLADADIDTITIAAQLHDIGKIGISDIVLLKNPAHMTPEENAEYRTHSVRGQSAVDSLEDLREAGVLIRHHHEWFNGKGFPDRLREKGIPEGSRIIALADQFDRMMHGYTTHSVKNVLEAMRALLGTRFDPELFPLLVETATERYSSHGLAGMETAAGIEAELPLLELLPGMVIARDISSGTGVLLLSKGTVLNEQNISALKRSFHIDPSKTGIYVRPSRK